jgi:hypothetical protein
VALSIVLVVIAVGGWVVAAGMEFMFLAFTDYCPPERCSAEGAATSVMVSVSVAAAVTLIGSVWTIVRPVRRRLGWPHAVATLIVSAAVELLGFVGYFAAVGH